MMRARIDTFITAISKLRLGILTEQGEGACSFFRSSFIYLFIYIHTHWRTAARGPTRTRTRRGANEAPRRDNDRRVRSDETPHGIDGGGVPLTSDGVTRPRIVAARRPPRSVYSSGFRKCMASPRHDRSSVMKPSRASGYSKSDDRAPSRARSAPSCTSDVTKSSSSPRAGDKAPPTYTSDWRRLLSSN